MGKASFKTLLRALGFLMARASRKHPWFRNQVTRDLVIEFKSHDGVAHHYEFVAARREVISKQGPAPRATVSVCFDSAAHGFRALSHPHPSQQGHQLSPRSDRDGRGQRFAAPVVPRLDAHRHPYRSTRPSQAAAARSAYEAKPGEQGVPPGYTRASRPGARPEVDGRCGGAIQVDQSARPNRRSRPHVVRSDKP